MKGPTGDQVQDFRDKTSEKFEFVAHRKGVHRFCFTNKSPYHETIDFDVQVNHFSYYEQHAKDGACSLYSCIFIFIFRPLNPSKENMDCFGLCFIFDHALLNEKIILTIVFAISSEHLNPLLEQISKLEEALYNIQFEQHWLEAQTERQALGIFLMLS